MLKQIASALQIVIGRVPDCPSAPIGLSRDLMPRTTVEIEMSQNGIGLTPQQRQAALLEAAGADRATAAQAAGVSEKSVSRWRSREAYRAAVREYEGSDFGGLAGAAQAELAIGAVEAARAVRELLRAEMTRENPDASLITAIARVLVAKAPTGSTSRRRPDPVAVTVAIEDTDDGGVTTTVLEPTGAER